MLEFIWKFCIVIVFETHFNDPMTEMIEYVKTKSNFLEVIILVLFALIYGVINALYTLFRMLSFTIQVLLFKKVYVGVIDGQRYYVTLNI